MNKIVCLRCRKEYPASRIKKWVCSHCALERAAQGLLPGMADDPKEDPFRKADK